MTRFIVTRKKTQVVFTVRELSSVTKYLLTEAESVKIAAMLMQQVYSVRKISQVDLAAIAHHAVTGE